MSVRDELIKHQGVLIDAKPSSFWSSFFGTPTLTGQFEAREVQFGVRQISKSSREIFFKIKLERLLDLPFFVWDYCPIVIKDGSEPQRSSIRIEGRRWLIERVYSIGGEERYFREQTDEMLRVRLSSLVQLGHRIETGQFSMEESLAVFKKNIMRDFLIALGIVCLFVAGAFFLYFREFNVPYAKSQQQHTQSPLPEADSVRRSRTAQADPNIFLKAVAGKTTVYPNEQFLLTYALYTRYDTRYEGFEEEGRFRGFWVERKKSEKDVTREEVIWQGKKFIKATVRTLALFPAAAGKKVIFPGSAKVSIRQQNGATTNKILSTEPVEIAVKDFPPAGQPAFFSGMSSEHLALEASLKFPENGSKTLDLILKFTGNGNLWGLQLPAADVGLSLSVLQTSDHTETSWDGNTVVGSKTFTLTLLPRVAGEVSIPAVAFSYFDSVKQVYEKLNSGALTVRITDTGITGNISEENEKKPGVIILLDVSGSMLAEDFQPGNRLSVAKDAVKEFINVKPDWKVGVKVFASEVMSVDSLREPDQKLLNDVSAIHSGMGSREDGTAIGDAVLAAVKELKQYRSREKTIILLSDGANNAGHLDPFSAADLAKQEGAVIYAIGLGRQGLVPFPVDDPKYGRRLLQVEIHADDRVLKETAEITGGKYFKSEYASQLRAILRTIGDAIMASNK